MHRLILLAALASFTPAIFAQSLEFTLRAGDVIPGVGVAANFDVIGVASDGAWGAWVQTDFPDTARDSVLVMCGAVVLRENDPVQAPAGWFVRFLHRLDMLPGGNTLFVMGLRDGSGGQLSGLYVNSRLLLLEDAPTGAVGFPPGSTYGRFDNARFIAPDRLLVFAQIDMPGIGWRDAMLEVVLDAAGDLASEEILYQWGDVPPGQTEPLLAFGVAQEHSATTRSAGIMWGGQMLQPGAANYVVYLGDKLIVKEGDPTPWPGFTWGPFSDVEVAANGNGDWVFKTNYSAPGTGFDWVVFKNGAPVVFEGDVLPDLAPLPISNFGTDSPVHIGPTGDVVWHAYWDDPNTVAPFGNGIFVNRSVLARSEVTVVEGVPLTGLPQFEESSRLSPNGRYLVFHAYTGQPGQFNKAIVLATLSIGGNYCDAVPNSTGLPSRITAMGSDVAADNRFRLRCDDMPNESFAHFFHSMMTTHIPMAGGSMGTLCVGGTIGRLAQQIQNSGPEAFVAVDVDLAALPLPTGTTTVVAGETWHFSCWYRDVNPGPTSNFSDAVSVTFR